MACIRWHVRRARGLHKVACQEGVWLYQKGKWTENLAQCRVVGGQSCWMALIGEMGYKDLDLEQGFDYSVGVVTRI